MKTLESQKRTRRSGFHRFWPWAFLAAGLLVLLAGCGRSARDREPILPVDQMRERVMDPGMGRWAVVIGISDYKYDVRWDTRWGIPDLRFAARDAEAFARFLQSPAGGAFPRDRVMVLTDWKATSGEVRKALGSFLARSLEEDLVMIFFSGHVVADPLRPGQLYLACHDTEPEKYPETAFSLRELAGLLQTAIHSKQVFVLLDGFRSQEADRMAGGSLARELNDALEGFSSSRKGITMVTGSSDREFSYEMEELGGGHGVFAYYLLEGLGGQADRNRDGFVTMAEAFAFLKDRVRSETRHAQTPWATTYLNDDIPLGIVDPQVLLSIGARAPGHVTRSPSPGLPSRPLPTMDLPRDSQVLLKLARARLAKDDPDTAMTMVEEVIARGDDATPDALALKIAILLQEGDLDGAEKTEDFLVFPYPEHAAAREGARLILDHYLQQMAAASPEEGIRRLETYLRRHPDGPLEKEAQERLKALQDGLRARYDEGFQEGLLLAKGFMVKKQFDLARDELKKAEELAYEALSEYGVQLEIEKISLLRRELERSEVDQGSEAAYLEVRDRLHDKTDEERIGLWRDFLAANQASPFAGEAEAEVARLQDALRPELQTRYDLLLSDARDALLFKDFIRCEGRLDSARSLAEQSERNLGIVLRREDDLSSRLRQQMEAEQQREQVEWEEADASARVIVLDSAAGYDKRMGVYQSFLEKWPGGRFGEEAERTLDLLSLDRADFMKEGFEKHVGLAKTYFERKDFARAYEALEQARAFSTAEDLEHINELARKHNSPPEVQILMDAETVEWETPVQFGFKAVDREGDPVQVKRWDFGDGNTATSSEPAHVYARWIGDEKERRYRVALTVSDPYNEVTVTRVIVVTRQDPVQTFTIKGVSFRMVRLSKGRFVMGSPFHEPGSDHDETRHTVQIVRDYWLGETEVTQGLWKAVMGNNPSGFSRCGDDCPVEQVSWNDVQRFFQQLNSLIPGGGFRLPTEAEWEYGCRAGTLTAFSSGPIKETECGHDPSLDRVAWYCGNAGKATHPVGQKSPNAWGLHDMHGNVYEWCQDWYGEYPANTAVDPKGPSTGSYRVLRGGSWDSAARYCRSASRRGAAPDSRHNDLGFRLCRDLISPERN